MKRRLLTILVLLILGAIELGAARDIGAGARANYRPGRILFDNLEI